MQVRAVERFFGQDSDEAALDELLGDDLNDVGFEDWELAGDFSQSCEPAVEPCSVGALELGATQIPRGPVLDDGNFFANGYKCFHMWQRTLKNSNAMGKRCQQDHLR